MEDDKVGGALTLLQESIDRRLADRSTDGNADEELQLARDIVLADMRRQTRLNHLRGQKLEAMLAFLLEGVVVEGMRRPTPDQIAVLGPDVAMLQTRRTRLDEFNARWEGMKNSPTVAEIVKAVQEHKW